MTHCQYCKGPVRIVDAEKVYGKNRVPKGNKVALCEPCQAWVSCHKSGIPMGTVAKANLRSMRKLLHDRFDPLWREKLFRGKHYLDRRKAAYMWLAEQMNISPDQTHFGKFNEEQTREALAHVNQYVQSRGCSFKITPNGIRLMKGEAP